MQRKFLGNLLFLQALNWLVKPVWIFWIDRLAQVKLGDQWYGRYYVVFSFALLFNILLDFGLNTFLASSIARNGDRRLAGRVIRVRIILAAFFVALVLLLGIQQKLNINILILVVINQLLAGFVLLVRSVLQGRHFFKTDSIVSVTDRLVAILLAAFFIYGKNFNGQNGIYIFLMVQTAGYTVALMIASIAAFRGENTHTENELPGYAALIRQAGWFAVMAFAMSVFTRIDALMIRNLSKGEFAEAGIYAQSFRLLDAALIFSSLISTLLLPHLSKMIGSGEDTHRLVWLNARIIWFVSIPAALAAYYFGPEIMFILYRKTYHDETELFYSASVFFPLMLSFVMMGSVHVFGTWLTAAHRVKWLSFIAIFCIAANVILNYFFIPEYGSLGAAWSCLITQFLFAAACMVGTIRLKGFSPGIRSVVMMIMWVLISVAFFGIARYYFNGYMAMFMAAVLYLAATVISGIFHDEITKLLFRKK